MELASKEGEVLAGMRLRADAPIPEIAKLLGIKQSTTRSIVQRLADKRYFSPLRLVNVSKLGYTEYDITCALALRGAAARKRFFDYLNRSPQVSQIIEAGGVYHCSFTVCAQTPTEVDDFLNQLGEKFGSIFVNESIGVCLRYTIFPPKYLGRKFIKDMVVVTTERLDPSIDTFDRKILTVMCRHPEYSHRELARVMGQSFSTLSYRLHALEKKGVIVGCIGLIRPQLFNHQMFRVYLSLRGLTPTLKREIFQFAKQHPNVTYLIEWLGDWQFGFGIMVSHSDQAAALVNLLYDQFGDSINELSLFPVGDDIKMEFFPFDK